MHVVIVERNKLVGRKLARLFVSVGATAEVFDEPAAATAVIDRADLACADTFDADYLAEQLRAHPRLRGVLWTAEPLRRSLRYLAECERLDHVLARRDFESPPHAWEVVMTARRLADAGAGAPPLAGFLDWGFQVIEVAIASTADRDVAVTEVQHFITALAVPPRVAEMFGELAHELIMNAIYDAPVDASGRPKYASDRKADVRLADSERPVVRLATDGSRLVFQTRDPFGRLERRHVVDGLARGLAGGEQDRSHGGAGLGMIVCHNAASAMFFDVARGAHTEVTAVLDLDLNLRELRTQAKSWHFWAS